ADTDNDGGQEVITGQTTISSEGKLQCQSGMGHGDAMDVSELVPGKGIAVFSIHEGEGGMDAHDGATCTFYFKTTEPGTDSNRGRAEYVATGNETSASCYCGSCNVHQALCIDGSAAGQSPGTNFVMYWDADLWRETENANSISKAGGGTLLTCSECSGNNSTKNTPTLTADLLGDWREEVVWRETAGAALRVYTTTDVTTYRLYTLMHDPTYRAQVAFENSAYNQPPHVGFRIAPNMNPAPVPNITIVK
ncbi:MAG: rhamnogalacturonan lyase, partial [Polyangia bacterium]